MALVTKKVRIDDIKVVDRIRKDYGDLNELAQDIAKWGLINYPVVTPDNVLIAGERRIRACRMLGWEEIPVVVMEVRDYEHHLRLEISENENRKEFTISERLEYARRLEQVERLKARGRQAIAGSHNLGLVQENFPELEKGQTRDKVAELVGFGSGKTYEKVKFVAEHGDPETIRRLDAGEISVHRAYQETRARLEAAERAAREAEARAEAERRKAEELAARLADAERALAEAKAGSAEAERLRAEAERLRRELEELKARPPAVVERVVEVPVEKVVLKHDPAVEARLRDAQRELAQKEDRIRELETELKKLAGSGDPELEALRSEVERLRAEKSLLEMDLKRRRPASILYEKLQKLFNPLEKAMDEVASLAEKTDLSVYYMRVQEWKALLRHYERLLDRAARESEKTVEMEVDFRGVWQ